MSALKTWAYRGISKALAWAARPSPPGLRVLMYHSVGGLPGEGPYGTSIAPGLFKRHMDWLASRRSEWDFVPFGRPSGARRELSLTFDDGYKDALTAAAPVLAALGLPMTVFVIAARLKEPDGLYLDERELKELAALPGVTIGAHGDTHARLDRLDDDALRRELAGSRRRLEDAIGRPVTALSYPHGAVDRRVRDAAEEAGFLVGGCSRYGLNGPDRDPLLLCRTEVTAWDGAEDLALKARGHWDWFRFRHRDPAAR